MGKHGFLQAVCHQQNSDEQAHSLGAMVALLFDDQMTGRIKDADSAGEPSTGPFGSEYSLVHAGKSKG